MIAALMVATLTANAQSGPFIKPMAGGTVATITGDVNELKLKVGFVGGVELGWQFGDHFALTGGALYTMQGARVSDDRTKYNVNIDTYKERLEERIIAYLSEIKGIPLEEAMDAYYRSRLADQISKGLYGIENMDYKYLAEDLVENEPLLFAK